jgi:hypothetical protein
MSWHLQTPTATAPKLLAAIGNASAGSSRGGGAFAFATATGINLLIAEPSVQALLAVGPLDLIVGLDAITDTSALNALTAQVAKYPNLRPRAFLNSGNSCFHPKTIWFETPTGGVVVTGSGNLTGGGLGKNWEAYSIQDLSPQDAAALIADWDAWIAAHAAELKDLGDAEVLEAAALNRKKKSLIQKSLGKGTPEGAEIEETSDDLIAEEVIEIDSQAAQNPVLVAEVPRSGNRWAQVNFNLDTYQGYFGVKLGQPKTIRLYPIANDGTLGPAEDRHAVAVQSQNYRFEIGAAAGLQYPLNGNPIVIFERIGPDTYRYRLLMPPDADNTAVQAFLDANFVRTGTQKLRVLVDKPSLAAAWPANPFIV